MRIAIAQMRTRAGAFDETARRMVEQSRRAAEAGADLLVFPAPALCGVTPVGAPDREGFLLDLAECLVGLVEDLACPCVVPVLTDVDGTALPEALLVADGDVVPLRLAAYLDAAAADADEAEAARALPETEFAGARLGVAFTYEDLDDYDDYEYDVDVILFLSGYGFATDDVSSAMGSSLTEGRFLGDASATGAWVVGVGALGCYDSQVFCGSSFVLSPWGELAAQAPSLEEALLVCDVDPAAEGPLPDPLTPEVYDAPLMTWGALATGLADACERAGSADACVVVDATLPSMLLATLATDALGPTHVRALVPETASRADVAAAERLVCSLRLPEGNVCRLDLRAEKDPLAARDLAQARLAGLARETGAVPLGCVDKTALALEAPVGASAARVLPFADLYRSDLVALAHLRNTISPVIPRAAALAPAAPEAAGLDDLPSEEARLEFVDLVLSSYLEWELPVSDIAAERGHAEAVEDVTSRLRALDSARAVPGEVVAVTSKTLAEARGPRGLAWRDRVRPDDERAGRRLLTALERLGAAPGDELEPGRDAADERDREREVHDLLGYLRDFSQGGGLSGLPQQGPGEGGGRHGSQGGSPQPLWEGPFSEN